MIVLGLSAPNGAGKSTLLKILLNQMDTDGGTVSVRRGLKIGFLEQVPQFQQGATIESTVMEGALDAHDRQDMARAQEIMSKLGLTDGEKPISELSGGWKKRAALARELMRQPELLLLDEPTNHLDIESILWLENLLANSQFATITVTHDRLFLQRVSNRILELDRRNAGGLLNIKGSYIDYAIE